MASGPEGSEKLNCQKWVLKVSIHCEGCKKKVKKVLKGVEGIYSVDIESKQNRATVIGNVEAETLIRRLLKHGKHAELWPVEKPSNPSSSPAAGGDAEAKGNEKAPTTVSQTEAKQANSEKSSQADEGKAAADVKAEEEQASCTTDVKPTNDVSVEAPKGGGCDEQEKIKLKEEDTSEASNKNTAKEKDETNKEQREKNTGEETKVSVKPTDQSASGLPPSHPSTAYPHPLYTVSYNTSFPQTNYSYYAMRSPAVRSDDFYSINAPPAFYSPNYYPPEACYGSMEQPPATSTGTYDIFNEENPNACSVM
ncbi:hypothetical protein HPP92_006926 [Vanilla planifolia]|uniref:HMA domain-containing protein n=1 Tax=Vanilla planifolia TaxID=51239 RepID=A0A835RH84_VANPL|nr:hypothetical protein HPP92_006926 [Vanilla planifolia]